MFRTILCFFLSLSCLALAGCGLPPAPAGKEYERVVVISDLHYPSKTRDNPKRQAIMDNKAKARAPDIGGGFLHGGTFCGIRNEKSGLPVYIVSR